MFINDKIIYLQLQKTGCTHITRLLTSYVGGAAPAKHGRLDRPTEGRTVIGSVRNPWDWYVSLWAYGCMGNGGIETRLTARRLALAGRNLRAAARHPSRWAGLPRLILRQTADHDLGFWRRVYRDPSDPGAFREWLIAINEPRVQNMVFEDSRVLPVHTFAGLYTARLVYLYSYADAWDCEAPTLTSLDMLKNFFEQHKILDRMIRTEAIPADLAEVMKMIGHVNVTETVLAGEGRTNASKRDAFEMYYDTETLMLVAERDRLVIETFGYTPPQLSTMSRAEDT